MNGTLGRDKIWNDQIWSDIDKAVREEVGRIRVAQKVFPTTLVNNVLPVTADNFYQSTGAQGYILGGARGGGGAVLHTGEDLFRPFIELSIEFILTPVQVDGEENMRLAKSLARRAASLLASAEDTILFLGDTPLPALTAADKQAGKSHVVTNTGVTVSNRAHVQQGFVADAPVATQATAVPGSRAWAAGPGPRVAGALPAPPGAPGDLGNILAAVAAGIAKLNSRAQPGPYALFLSPGRYGQTFEPLAGQLLAPGDQINNIVTNGFHMVNGIGDDMGILVSLGGEPTRIVLGLDATTAFTYADLQGDYYFRTFERIQLVVQDSKSFQRLKFG
jgi:uncharacterized linocin/CFP29 family protein